MATVRPIRETIPLDEARALLLDATRPIERTEKIPIAHAHGRVIASAPVSTLDVPPFDRAAMDGYAVIADNTFGASASEPKVLRSLESVFTGEIARQRVTRGTCIQVATGAPLPEGADAVVMVEETEKRGDDEIRILTPVYPRQHVGRRGADITTGQTLLAVGDVLTPSRVGALAAVGLTEVDVFAQPRVAIMSTGGEIVEPGQPLAPGHLYDINRFTLSAIVGAHGGVPIAYPSVADDLAALKQAVTTTEGDDIVVFSGGSSVGEHDLVIDVIGGLGEVIFHGIAVKPGKPTTFGTIGRRPVLGMPGYPTSCLSNGYMLLVPLLRKMARLPEYQPHTVRLPLSRRIVSTTGRHQFYTVRIQDGAAVPAFKASGDITSMAHADGYIEIPAQTDIVEAGEVVVVKLF
jgi:molybdenum cofactor synthesis domain-containing protein